jgi:hypothetical protein
MPASGFVSSGGVQKLPLEDEVDPKPAREWGRLQGHGDRLCNLRSRPPTLTFSGDWRPIITQIADPAIWIEESALSR